MPYNHSEDRLKGNDNPHTLHSWPEWNHNLLLNGIGVPISGSTWGSRLLLISVCETIWQHQKTFYTIFAFDRKTETGSFWITEIVIEDKSETTFFMLLNQIIRVSLNRLNKGDNYMLSIIHHPYGPSEYWTHVLDLE